MAANCIGVNTIPRLTKTNPRIEEVLVRDDNSNELYKQLSSTRVLRRQKEMLYVPLIFEKSLTIDALVDCGALVSAIARSHFEKIKQQARTNFFKNDDSPNYQIKMAKGPLGKPITTTTLKLDMETSSSQNTSL